MRKFFPSYQTERFSIVLTSDRCGTIASVSWIKYTPLHPGSLISILILPSHLHADLVSGIFICIFYWTSNAYELVTCLVKTIFDIPSHCFRELAAEQLEEMRRLQSYWMELRQYIRMVYRMAMEGRTVENSGAEDYEDKMKDLVQK